MSRRGRFWCTGFAVLGLTVLGAGVSVTGWAPHRGLRLDAATERVRRDDLSVTLTASGTVESTERTIIECQLEALEVRVRGQGMTSSGAATILEIVPDGAMVGKGDVLCRLDSSDYKEMARQQEMNVGRAQADHRMAELELEVAQVGLREFRDGLQLQTIQELEGKIALARSDTERGHDRMAWIGRMLAKGYVSAGQLSSERINAQRAANALEQNRTELDVFRRYRAPKTLRVLGNQVQGARAILDYQEARLQRHQSRMTALLAQVEHCTIRAPHDGMVIHANDPRRQVLLEPGSSVRQKQVLFSLPDLTRMEVSTLLHETVVDRVRGGMLARVRVEGVTNRVQEGHVVSIAQLPTRNLLNDVPYYIGLVKLDTIPRGLRPGMSAEVEIATERRHGVLTIPAGALTIVGGRRVCYVAHGDGVERREIEIGQTTRDRLEVTSGLDEGEEVVLDPARPDAPAWDGLASDNAGEGGESAPIAVTH